MPPLAALDIVHDLHDPIIVEVPDRRVPVAGHLVVQLRVQLRNRRDDVVRVQVACRRGVDETDDVPVFEVPDRAFGIDGRFVSFWGDDPVVAIFVSL